ncbi:NEDD8 activating enzyme, partial [Coemansia sp. RSA 486]
LDGDDPEHINWLVEKASERAIQFNISGVNYSLTQGVVKNIIPAIASTNAIIAAVCTNEALKLVTSCNPFLDNYLFYSGDEGIHSYSFCFEKDPDCLVCGNRQGSVTISGDATLQDLIDELKVNRSFQLKAPTLTCGDTNLYFQNPKELEELTRPNLDKKLCDLFETGSTLTTTDQTLPTSLQVTVSFS